MPIKCASLIETDSMANVLWKIHGAVKREGYIQVDSRRPCPKSSSLLRLPKGQYLGHISI